MNSKSSFFRFLFCLLTRFSLLGIAASLNVYAENEGIGVFAGQRAPFKRVVGEVSKPILEQNRRLGNLIEAPTDVIRDDAGPFVEKTIYHLNPDIIYEIARESITNSHVLKWNDTQLLNDIEENLQRRYAFIDSTGKWTINNTLGVTGNMKILYATRREYLILYGSSIDSIQGQTGRYSMDIRTTIVRGEQFTQLERAPQAVHVHYTGDRAFLPKGTQKTYTLNGWILEYGRGRVWTSFPDLFWSNEGQNIREQLGQAMRMSLHEMFFGR